MTNENILKQCTIVLTRACNLRCNFCYVKNAGYDINDKINYNDLKRIVDFCCDSPIKYIFFTGGEPLLYPYITDILQYIKYKKSSIITAVATNGILLKNIDFCKQLLDSGIGYIDISMKGHNSKEWKTITSYDGFLQQKEAIYNLSSLPIEFTCSMVITPENVETFCDSVRIAHDNGAKQFSFTFFIDNNNLKDKNLSYLKKHNPFTLINNFLSHISQLNSITKDWWIEYSFPMCIYTEEQLSLLKGKLATPCQIHMKNAITFNTKMELLPCDMYINQKMGQLDKDFSSYCEFKEFTKLPSYKCTMNALRKLPSKICSSCQYLKSCYGGCPVLWKNYSFETLHLLKNLK